MEETTGEVPMIEVPRRTLEQVKKDYANHCAQVGENEYRILVLTQHNSQLKQTISKLNTEAEDLTKEVENGKNQSN